MSRTSRRMVAAVVCIFLGNVRLGAWGDSGHRIVSLIESDHLTQAARATATAFLDGQTLAEVPTEADRIKQPQPGTKNWHFVDMPKSKTDYDAARDCQPSDAGDCIIAAIERFRTTLADGNASAPDRKVAPISLIHLIGDLRQPLHCSDNNDRGGDEVRLKWFGKRSNLHAVWDAKIIDEAALTAREFADKIAGGLDPSAVAPMQAGTVLDWALEAHALAKSHADKIPYSRLLGPQYYDNNVDTVDQQLLRARIRLANVLNDAFGS